MVVKWPNSEVVFFELTQTIIGAPIRFPCTEQQIAMLCLQCYVRENSLIIKWILQYLN